MPQNPSMNTLLRAEIRALYDALTALLREVAILREERDAMARAIRLQPRSTARRKKSEAH